MELNRYCFDILVYLEKNGTIPFQARNISDSLSLSVSTVESCFEKLQENHLLEIKDNMVNITAEGIAHLQPYRVKQAVIMAAGFGQRMVPVTLERPKPMVKVNGVRIIDTLIDALLAADINEIIIVRGYKKEIFDELIEKYPFVKFIDNDDYDKTNNISSVIKAIDYLDSCYLCEADLLVTSPEVISKFHFRSNILGSYSVETDDWCFRMIDGCVSDFRQGNTFCYNEYGITYWTKEDSEELRKDYLKTFNATPEGKQLYWDYIPFVLFKDKYKVEIRQCSKSDITEIDSFHELKILDSSYEDFRLSEAE